MVTLSQDERGEDHPGGAHETGNVRQLTDVPRVDGDQPHGMRSTDTDTLVVGGGAGRPAPAPSERLSVVREAALVVGLWLVYSTGRFLAARHTGRAYAHAATVWHLERQLLLPDEVTCQRLLLDHALVGVRLADDYYRWIHLPLTILVLAGFFRFRPAHYLWVRTAMAYATAAALVIHIAYPVAPPRMLQRLGFVDTGLRFGQSAYGSPGHDHLANEFAAMPSLHVGWAVLLAVAVIVTFRTPWRWLAVLHPVVTTLVVVVTANHFWLDGLAGTALALAALAAAPRPGRTPPRSQRTGGCPSRNARRGWRRQLSPLPIRKQP